MKLKICRFFLILVGFWGAAKAGADPAQYLDLDPGARPSGLGSAFTALADDGNAQLFNPAGLTTMGANSFQASGSIGFLTLGRLNDYFGASQQLPPDSYLGFYVDHYQVDSIDGRDLNGLPTSGLQDLELAFGATYAYDFGYNFKAGIGTSFLYQDLVGTNATGFGGVDLGLLYIPSAMYDFTLGASVRHLGGFVSWATGTTEGLIPDLRLGASQKFLNQTIILAYDAEWQVQSTLTILHHVGAEAFPWKFLGFRTGLDNANPTFGASLRYLNYALDYSYEIESNNGLGDTQRLGLNFSI
jgi:hypothetical protein